MEKMTKKLRTMALYGSMHNIDKINMDDIVSFGFADIDEHAEYRRTSSVKKIESTYKLKKQKCAMPVVALKQNTNKQDEKQSTDKEIKKEEKVKVRIETLPENILAELKYKFRYIKEKEIELTKAWAILGKERKSGLFEAPENISMDNINDIRAELKKHKLLLEKEEEQLKTLAEEEKQKRNKEQEDVIKQKNDGLEVRISFTGNNFSLSIVKNDKNLSLVQILEQKGISYKTKQTPYGPMLVGINGISLQEGEFISLHSNGRMADCSFDRIPATSGSTISFTKQVIMKVIVADDKRQQKTNTTKEQEYSMVA